MPAILKLRRSRVVAPPNIFDARFEYDDEDPAGYKSAVARVGAAAGGKALAVKLFELPAGQALCPYHYEYEEEWLIVLEGAGVVVRVPGGEKPLMGGDVMCFPPGPDGAHKVINRGEDTARVLMFSSAREPAVAVYPDSDKIGVWTPGGADNVMVRRRDGDVGYWEDEPPG
jgi:uncharacterized cupin superfamily protein